MPKTKWDSDSECSVAISGTRRPLPDHRVAAIIAAVCRAEGSRGTISVTFLGRATMRHLNRKYLGHDYPTDVISFPLHGPDQVFGDIYICASIAGQNARERGVPPQQEVVRLLVHAMLHILGYNHPDDESRERSPMWQRQEALVRQLQ